MLEYTHRTQSLRLAYVPRETGIFYETKTQNNDILCTPDFIHNSYYLE